MYWKSEQNQAKMLTILFMDQVALILLVSQHTKPATFCVLQIMFWGYTHSKYLNSPTGSPNTKEHTLKCFWAYLTIPEETP